MRPEDSELLTRHEVLANPPDILITNYSMLEYMMMRPLERPIFDATREWLAANPDERLLLVLDEAHMYRGAAGAEVSLLIRRLRARLAIPAERLQVICTSASFHDPDYAPEFASQLAGKSIHDFRTITGELDLREQAACGTELDARALAHIPLKEFYEADESGRIHTVVSFLQYRGIESTERVGSALFEALHDFPPMGLLVNLTMREAKPLHELGQEIFAIDDRGLADRALTALIALGSCARRKEGEPGLLPCRVHSFFRGLPGLWGCLDSDCSALPLGVSSGPVGALYAQPRDICSCGARVFEIYTCRNCGSAYARAYTDDLQEPSFLWNEPGRGFQAVAGRVAELLPIDLLLEPPSPILEVEPADVDLVTGRLNPKVPGERARRVFLKLDRAGGLDDESDDRAENLVRAGEFRPCGVCGETAGYGRSSVQDHQTKGDQPFQALVTSQIQVQPPGPQPASEFAPLRGRKVLVFSDSRQTAARLAPTLQTYSMRDSLRPLILRGWQELESVPLLAPSLSLESVYLATLIGSHLLSVRLRPELRGTESLRAAREVATAVRQGALHDPVQLIQLVAVKEAPPQSLLRGMVDTITDRYFGLQSLALASLRGRRNLEIKLLKELSLLRDIGETDEQKLALVRLWVAQWTGPSSGIWFENMNPGWWQTPRGVRPHSGRFSNLDQWIANKDAKKSFIREWLPVLLGTFCEQLSKDKNRILANYLALELGGQWGYCQACRTTQRPFPGSVKCIKCGRDEVLPIVPDEDPVFAARKGYYRNGSVRALTGTGEPVMAIIAAEHTAQLNSSQADEVFSTTEKHELLFQDIDLGVSGPMEQEAPAIDVLSCTTTMEVGIDIGNLSGVALRNMPPSRSSYQQRAGRAGRRGNAVATVVAFGSADSHDEHYFSEPDAMIRGQVEDPILTLDNSEIARRHVTAFLLQGYHHARLPQIDPEEQSNQLFEVLGTVDQFLSSEAPLNRADLETWLRQNESRLVAEVRDWLPEEISTEDREQLLNDLIIDTLRPLDEALASPGSEAVVPEAIVADGGTEDAVVVEAPAEEGEERANPRRAATNLLDRLLYKGVLPRYAFPTDVVSFCVFDRVKSTRFRHEYRYAPSQGLPVALTQYAPGKRVWIDGKEWTSGALYSPIADDRYRAWQEKRLYLECQVCHYARTEGLDQIQRGESLDCPACGGQDKFGPAMTWIRPPGFAHPQFQEEGTAADDQPEHSYATRAKLVAPGPADADSWRDLTPSIRQYYQRTHLLVTNTGPRQEGYTYCTRCGIIEPTAMATATVSGPHPKPYPDEKNPDCPGAASARAMVLGTDFISDVLLISLRVESPLTLRPGLLATDVALRSLVEAITLAATRRLEIEPSELQGEYRPALTHAGSEGLEAEVYLYDTLAGGAGFARRIGDLGHIVLEDAIELLEHCPAGCDRSCYRCLRRFTNRFEHDLLDRHLAASLLRYLVAGDEPVLISSRVNQAADALYADLCRQGLDDVEFERHALLDLPGIGGIEAPILVRWRGRQLIIGIHAPLTPDHPADEQLRQAKEYGAAVPVLLIDEIVIWRNLPRASQQVLEAVL